MPREALGIVGLAEMELKSVEEAKKYCSFVKQQTENLNLILLILVQTTRITKGEKIIHKINFQEFIDHIIRSLETSKNFMRINFKININTKKDFYSDKLMLISMFQNIIDNSIKYHNEMIETSFVKIAVEDHHKGVKILIEDNGIGIPDNLRKSVFNIFFRANDNVHGSGLGLYTVKHIIKKLDGEITLESKERKRITFTLLIPSEEVDGYVN